MRIGVPTEVKDHEFRVALTPAGIRELTLAGHEVLVHSGAGAGSAIGDRDVEAAGGRIVSDVDEVWGESDLVCKVKEPTPEEYRHLRDDLTLFAFLHLAADEALTDALCESGVLAVAYETVTDADGGLPLLAPMSEVAGRMAPQVGAASLERERGGRGVLLGGVSGISPGHVVVVGAGTAGRHAALLAAGLQARVTVLDIDLGVLRAIDALGDGRITTLHSNRWTLDRLVEDTDLLIGAVLVPGARAPHVVTEEMVAAMPDGSVVVDIAVDQGGCVATTHMTTHAAPTYLEHGVVHYAVGNMPGAVPHTSTRALTIATLPYVLRLADGIGPALAGDPGLLAGVNVAQGEITNDGVASAHGRTSADAATLVGAS